MRDHKGFICFILIGLCLPVWGCSLIFDPDKYVGKKKDAGGAAGDEDGGSGGTGGNAGGAGKTGNAGGKSGGAGGARATAGRGGAAGQGGSAGAAGDGEVKKCENDSDCGANVWICDNGVCFNCDQDKDTFYSNDKRCEDLIAPGEIPDCNDNDDTVYPFAPAICGDGKINSCNINIPDVAKENLGVTEIGNVGAAVFAAQGVVTTPNKKVREIAISAATQLSLSAGVVTTDTGAEPVVGALTFIDAVPSQTEPIARMVGYNFIANGLVEYVRPFDLNQLTSAKAIRSVAIRRLPGNKSRIALVGKKEIIGSDIVPVNGIRNVLWYLDIDHSANIGEKSQSTEVAVTAECAPVAEIRPRIAITAKTATWFQGAGALTSSPIALSHTYGSTGFTCPATTLIDSATAYVEMSGSSGAFAIGDVRGAAFVWGGASPPANIPGLSVSEGRRAIAQVNGNSYLAAVGTGSGYEVTALTCDETKTSEPCAVGPKQTPNSGYSSVLAAMDDLGNKGALLAVIENSSFQNIRTQEAVIRLFDAQGRLLTPSGFQDAAAQPSGGVAIPVWRTSYAPQSPAQGDLRIVDMAISAWVDQTGNSKYGFVILTAAIATNKFNTATVSNGAPDPGEFIIVSGLRGCRKQ